MLCLEARPLEVPGTWAESMGQWRAIPLGARRPSGTRKEVLADQRPAVDMYGLEHPGKEEE